LLLLRRPRTPHPRRSVAARRVRGRFETSSKTRIAHVAELLAEIGRRHGIEDDIAARLQRYAEVDHDLLAALGELPERQRAIVVARYYYGLSYDEISEHFDIKSGTVGATLHQAIERLRQIQLAGRLARGAMR